MTSDQPPAVSEKPPWSDESADFTRGRLLLSHELKSAAKVSDLLAMHAASFWPPRRLKLCLRPVRQEEAGSDITSDPSASGMIKISSSASVAASIGKADFSVAVTSTAVDLGGRKGRGDRRKSGADSADSE
jgi:hypothetical protein